MKYVYLYDVKNVYDHQINTLLDEFSRQHPSIQLDWDIDCDILNLRITGPLQYTPHLLRNRISFSQKFELDGTPLN